MRVRSAALAAVLVDREDALDTARRSAESLLNRVAKDAFGQAPVQPREALGRPVIDRENEAEVDRVPEPSRVLDEGLPDRLLVAAERAVARADPVELAPLSVAQPFLAVRDVTHLVRRALRAVVVVRLDEEHVSSSLPCCSRAMPNAGLVPPRRWPAPTRRRRPRGAPRATRPRSPSRLRPASPSERGDA